MNIRSLMVERGIATLAHQTHLSTLFSFSRSRNTGDNAGASSVEAISSRLGARQDSQEIWELEGGHFDDGEENEGPGWWDENYENEAVRQGKSRIISTGADDDV